MWVDARDMLCEAWVGYGNSLSSLYVFFPSFLSLYRSLYRSAELTGFHSVVILRGLEYDYVPRCARRSCSYHHVPLSLWYIKFLFAVFLSQ